MTHNRLPKLSAPSLRVSHLTFVRVMSAVIADTAGMAPEEAIAIISAVRNYLSQSCVMPEVAGHEELLAKYRDLIDRAALRSARARQAALNRRKDPEIHTEAPTEAPSIQNSKSKIQNSPTPAPSIQNSKSKIQNSPTPAPAIQNSKSTIQNSPSSSSRPRIKIKHKSRGRKNFDGPKWSR